MDRFSVFQFKVTDGVTLKLLKDCISKCRYKDKKRNVHHHRNWSPRQHVANDQLAHDAEEIVSRPSTNGIQDDTLKTNLSICDGQNHPYKSVRKIKCDIPTFTYWDDVHNG